MDGLVMKYFVLNPTKQDVYGFASRKALLTYAEIIKRENPILAKDLFDWYNKIQGLVVKDKTLENIGEE